MADGFKAISQEIEAQGIEQNHGIIKFIRLLLCMTNHKPREFGDDMSFHNSKSFGQLFILPQPIFLNTRQKFAEFFLSEVKMKMVINKKHE